MYSKALRQQIRSFQAAERNASGTRTGPEALFVWTCGEISSGRKLKWQEKKEMTGDGASERSEEKTEFWAVATPL
jgi:hypothetical protein